MPTETILAKGKQNTIIRVLQEYDIPFQRYPQFGTWCYIISGSKGLHVLDPGAKYSGGMSWPRQHTKETGNLERLLECLDKNFPRKKVESIILTHRHFDHAELAPALQEKLAEKQGSEPPIRAHKLEHEQDGLGLIDPPLETTFRRAGYTYWNLGKDLRDGEKIYGTGFKVRLLPGHTPGTICLVNDDEKILITPYNPEHLKKTTKRLAFRILDSAPENRHHYRDMFKGFQIYTSHP